MMRFLRAFIKPYEDVFRLVAMVPAIVLLLANELLDLALAKRDAAPGQLDHVDGEQPEDAPAIIKQPPT